MLILGFPLGFFASGIFSDMGPVLSVALGSAIGIFAAISYAIVILAALALHETRERELLPN
jgi:hypothetical protein